MSSVTVGGIAPSIKQIPIPHLEQSEYDYQNEAITPRVINQDGSEISDTYMTASGSTSGKDAGEYEIYVTLKTDSDVTYQWVDNDGNVIDGDTITLNWKINSITVNKPTIEPTEYDYSGNSSSCYKMPTITGFDSKFMTQSGIGTNGQYKAGEYPITFSLIDNSSCSWAEGGTEDYTVTWRINPITVKIPVATSDFTYDGKNHSAVIENYNTYVMMYSGTTSATNAGNYSITYILRDPDSCTWEDGTVENKTVYWSILKQVVYVNKPYLEDSQKEFIYDGSRKTPAITNFNSTSMSKSGTLSSVYASKANEPWQIVISLKYSTNYLYRWNVENEEDKSEENQTKDLILEWVVNKGVFAVPTLSINHTDYTGTSQKVTDSGYNTNVMRRSGTMYAAKVNVVGYGVTYEFLHPDSAVWEDGTNEKKTVRWYIDKAMVEIPTAEKTVYETCPTYAYRYTQYHCYVNAVTLVHSTINVNLVSVSGNSNSFVGDYTAVFKLIDTSSSSWKDGTTEDKTIDWKIVKKVEKLTTPYLNPKEFIYNKSTHTPNIQNNDSPALNNWAYDISGTTESGNVGKYSITINLKDYVYDNNLNVHRDIVDFQWEDGTTNPVTLDWEIVKRQLPKPTISPDAFQYDGNSHAVTVNNYNSTYMTYSSDTVITATAAGIYTVKVSLLDKEQTEWEDGTTDDVSYSWSIDEFNEVTVPTVENTEFTYDGSTHSPTITNPDSNMITISGVTSSSTAGNFEITFSLKDSSSSMWSDGTKGDKKFSWVIHKIEELLKKPSIAEDYLEVTYSGKDITPVLNNFVESKMSKTGNVTESAAGNHTITVSLKENQNYLYKWEDGTAEPIQLEWEIVKTVFDIPTLSSDLLFYGGCDMGTPYYYPSWRQPEVFGYNPDIMTSVGITKWYATGTHHNAANVVVYEGRYWGDYQWQVGSYTIIISLKDKTSSSWADGSTADINLEWRIAREIKAVEKPYLTDNNFDYKGVEITPSVINGNVEGVVLTGDLSGTAVGTYTIYANTKKIENEYEDIYDYRWSDGSTDEIPLVWYINDGRINIPTVSPTSFVYDGTPKLPLISGYNEDTMLLDAVEQTEVGEYSIIISLKDKASSPWTDNTTEDKVYKWYITPITVPKPTIAPESIMYDGVVHTVEFRENESQHSFVVSGFDENTMACKGDKSATNVGDYKTIISLKHPNSCTWTDGTTDDVELPWKITKKVVLLDKPYLKEGDESFPYDGSDHTPEIITLKEGMIAEGTTHSVKAGNFTITVSLKEDNNITYLWGDKTDTPVVLNWSVTKIILKKPLVTNTVFDYDGSSHFPTVGEYNTKYISQSTNSEQVKAGKYEIVFSFADKDSCEWEDGGSNDYVIPWRINKVSIDKPFLADTSFIYDGNEHAPTKNNWEQSNLFQVSGQLSAVNANTYEVVIVLKDKSSVSWSDNTTDDVTLSWVIGKKTVQKPHIENTEFTYNGGSQSPTVKNFIDDIMQTLSGSVTNAVNAGEYKVIIGFKTGNYQWNDGTSENIELPWKILKKSVVKPYLNPESYLYDGKLKSPVIEGFKTESMVKEGDLSGTDIGEYVITVSPKPNYQWEDASDGILSLTWRIVEDYVEIPTVGGTEFTYDGKAHSPRIGYFDTNKVTISGSITETNAGNYQLVFSLNNNKTTLWEDGTSADKVFPWIIHKKVLEKPTATNTEFEFNGGLRRPTLNNIDETLMNIEGVTEAIHAGVYNVRVALKQPNNYQYEDGSSAELNFGWTISRKAVSIPYLEPDTFTYDGKNKKPNIMLYNSSIMELTKESVTSAYKVGEYKITIVLVQTVYEGGYKHYYHDYQWDTGDINNIVLTWNITKNVLKYPTLIKDTLLYNGSSQSPEIDGYIPEAMKINGDSSAVNKGDYKISFALADTNNYCWEDDVVDNQVEYNWHIIAGVLKKSDFIIRQNPVLIYNQTYQVPRFDGYDKKKLAFGGDKKGRNAGSYTAEFTPNENYTWENGTRTPIEVPWVIEKCGIKNPEQERVLYYIAKTQTPDWDYNPNFVTINFSGETSGINAKTYYVTCVCDDNCYFLSTGTNTCNSSWKISKGLVTVPQPYREYDYTGEIIYPEFHNYSEIFGDAIRASGELSGVDVGDYVAKFEIIDKDNYTWKDFRFDSNDIVNVTWRIIPSIKYANVPKQSNAPMYDGTPRTPTWFNYDTNAMTLLGGAPSDINAGIYYATFRIKNGYVWRNSTLEGITEDQIVPWRIYKRKIYHPYINGTENGGVGVYYYELEGKRYPIWKNYDPDIMIMSGDTYDVDNSWHTTYFDFIDKDNYEWDDGISDTYSVRWKLTDTYTPNVITGTEKKVHIPRQINPPYEDGTTKYPKWDNFNNTAIIKIGGKWEGANKGTYNVVLGLEDGYVWEDGTNEVKIVPWVILGENEGGNDKLITIHIPQQINPPYYDGYVKEPEWDEWTEYGIDYKYGDLYGVPAGTYYITIAPKTGYIWEDGTTEDKTIPWVINPRGEEPVIPPENPREPDPEVEEEVGEGGGCCCNPCCDTGLFDKLNNYEFDDGFTCGCEEKTSV